MTDTAVNIATISAGHLCTGCGACSYVSGNQITMQDTATACRRPVTEQVPAEALTKAAAICPGYQQARTATLTTEMQASLFADWGPILEVWEGYATDTNMRFRGSSGGGITALATYALEQRNFAGAVHVQARADVPLLNQTVFSRDRAGLIAGSGSRYAPASPCDGLGHIAQADQPCVLIGKPCDIRAAHLVAENDAALRKNLGLTMTMFCAGTPSFAGTRALLSALGVKDIATVKELRYRGQGWPGEMTALDAAGKVLGATSYADGWGKILQKHRQWACRICTDHTGEYADISVGDPWYRPTEVGDPGRSLFLVRTQRGREMLQAAGAAGYLTLEQVAPDSLVKAQQHLLQTRAACWGRLFVWRRMVGLTPYTTGAQLGRAWWRHLSVREKLQSLYGTYKRIKSRRLNTPEAQTPLPADPTRTA
jgi:coenzyme F420 hydrogenase subunit beta